MKQHIENTRRQLGELGAMSAKTEAAERRILADAEKMLADVSAKIEAARSKDPDEYMRMVEERGRLQQIIAQARNVLES